MNKDTDNSQDLLQEAIRAASGGAGKPPPAARSAAAVSPSSIAEALQDHHATQPAKAAAQSQRSTHSPAGRLRDASLGAALSEVGAGGTAATARSSRQASVDVTTLAEAVSGLGNGDPLPASGAKPGAGTRRLAVIAIALLLMIAAGYGWLQSRPTGPTAVLLDLVSAVEHYRDQNHGKLPKNLAALEAFPKGAVEWPFRYWKARDAAGRTEIIWVPIRDHYTIVLRQGQEVWTVTDRARKPTLSRSLTSTEPQRSRAGSP